MVGFTNTRYTTFNGPLTLTIAAPTFNVSTYVPNPSASAATVRAGLQAALDAVGAAGGTLTFNTANTTYQINAKLNMLSKSRFRIVGNDCTIFHANGWNSAVASGNSMLDLAGSSNFRIEDITFDGNRDGTGVVNDEGPVSPNIHVRSCQNATFIRVKSHNAPTCEGFRIDVSPAQAANISLFPTNLLFYKCQANRGFRLGLFVRAARNLQILGGFFNATEGTQPASGMDFEPEVEAIPAIDQVLIRGASFVGNQRSGIQTTSKRSPQRFTIEGCYFRGGALPMPNPVTGHRGSGICVAASDILVQSNTFELFGTNYNVVGEVVGIPNVQAPKPNNVSILNNVFNDITQSTACIVASDVNSGPANSATGNRGYDIVGDITNPLTTKTYITLTNNQKLTGAPTYPSPLPPWDVTFAEDGGVTPPTVVVLVQGRSRTRGFGAANVVVQITSSKTINVPTLTPRTRALGTPSLAIGPVVVVPTGLARTLRSVGVPVITATEPPVVNVIVQGQSRTRELGTPTVSVVENDATVTPTGLSRDFRGVGVVNVTFQFGGAVVNVQGMERARDIGEPILLLQTVVTLPVNYDVLTDEQMDAALQSSGGVPIDPDVVRSCLLTLRDRATTGFPSEPGTTYATLTSEQMAAFLMDDTFCTVDSYVTRSVLLTLRDRIGASTPPTLPLGAYRILTSAEMDTLVVDNTAGYIDPFILRSAILTLRDWMNLN